MKILPAADRVASAWKNGGGTTYEIATWPPGAGFDDFDWRVSVADVRAGGPFSVFPSVDRILAVLAGNMTLIIDDTKHDVAPESAPLSFAGDKAVHAVLSGPPVVDLNVMTRRNVCRARLTRTGPRQLECHASSSLLIAIDDCVVRHDSGILELIGRDAVLLGSDTRCLSIERGHAYWVEIVRG